MSITLEALPQEEPIQDRPALTAAGLLVELAADVVDFEGSPDDREAGIAEILGNIDICGAINASSSDLLACGSLMNAFELLEVAAGGSYIRSALDFDRLDPAGRQAVQQLFALEHPAMLSVLDRAVNDEALDADAVGCADFVDNVTSLRFEGPLIWGGLRGEGVPECFGKIADTPEYPDICLQSVRRKYEADPEARDGFFKRGQDRATHIIARTALKMRPGLVEEYCAVIRTRTGRDEDGSNWFRIMQGQIDRVRTFGREAIDRLYTECGFVCVDYLSEAQIIRMNRLLDGDPTVIPPDAEITLAVVDVSDDHLDSARDQIAEYEYDSDEKVTFYCGFTEAPGVYMQPIRLAKKYGLYAHTIGFISHGEAGIVSAGRVVDFSVNDSGDDLDLRETQVGRFLRDYMRPSPRTGVRAIIMSGCEQGVPTEFGDPSVAETVLRLTDPADAVRVSGSGAYTSDVLRMDTSNIDDRALVRHLGRIPRSLGSVLFFWDVEEDVATSAHTYSWAAGGKVDHQVSPSVPGS